MDILPLLMKREVFILWTKSPHPTPELPLDVAVIICIHLYLEQNHDPLKFTLEIFS